MYDDLPFSDPATTPNPAAVRRNCHRHSWDKACAAHDAFICMSCGPFNDDTHDKCERCGKCRDEAATRRNRANRARGKRTSHELAAYLGGQDVESLNWPWDVQGDGWRIQSKRLAVKPGPGARLAYIEAIPAGAGYLRGFFHVGPRQRLAAGTVTLLLREWVDEHGWVLPAEGIALGLAPQHALVILPLPVFRDLHVGGAK